MLDDIVTSADPAETTHPGSSLFDMVHIIFTVPWVNNDGKSICSIRVIFHVSLIIYSVNR